MKQFYYQLKVKMKEPDIWNTSEKGYFEAWSSPIMRGIVDAEDSKSARKKIKEEIFEKEIKRGDDILLSIIEVKEDTQYLLDFFKPRVCKQCKKTFNTSMSNYFSHGGEFCSKACYDLYTYETLNNLDIDAILKKKEFDYVDWTECNPVIYRIYNRKSQKNYVGQTIRSFTLRWWEHYKAWIKYQKDDITNFEFSILEEFNKDEIKQNENLLSEREQYWINYYNALDENFGYNSRREVAEMKPRKATVEEFMQRKLW